MSPPIKWTHDRKRRGENAYTYARISGSNRGTPDPLGILLRWMGQSHDTWPDQAFTHTDGEPSPAQAWRKSSRCWLWHWRRDHPGQTAGWEERNGCRNRPGPGND